MQFSEHDRYLFITSFRLIHKPHLINQSRNWVPYSPSSLIVKIVHGTNVESNPSSNTQCRIIEHQNHKLPTNSSMCHSSYIQLEDFWSGCLIKSIGFSVSVSPSLSLSLYISISLLSSFFTLSHAHSTPVFLSLARVLSLTSDL